MLLPSLFARVASTNIAAELFSSFCFLTYILQTILTLDTFPWIPWERPRTRFIFSSFSMCILTHFRYVWPYQSWFEVDNNSFSFFQNSIACLIFTFPKYQKVSCNSTVPQLHSQMWKHVSQEERLFYRPGMYFSPPSQWWIDNTFLFVPPHHIRGQDLADIIWVGVQRPAYHRNTSVFLSLSFL